MRSARHKVLIVDDDPSNLEIYGLLLNQAGYDPVPALVRFAGMEFPAEPGIEGIILDHRLSSLESAADLARRIRDHYPEAPIVLLSDAWNLPTDMAPFVADFVRRGEPGQLLDKLARLVPPADVLAPEHDAAQAVL